MRVDACTRLSGDEIQTSLLRVSHVHPPSPKLYIFKKNKFLSIKRYCFEENLKITLFWCLTAYYIKKTYNLTHSRISHLFSLSLYCFVLFPGFDSISFLVHLLYCLLFDLFFFPLSSRPPLSLLEACDCETLTSHNSLRSQMAIDL